MTVSRSTNASEPGASEQAAPAKRQRPARVKPRKFYRITYKAYSSAKGVKLLNKDEVFRDSPCSIFYPPDSFIRGFRTYPVKPRMLVSKRLGHRLNDFEQHGPYWLVSGRTKRVLEQLSESDFQFLALDTEVDAGEEPMTLWLCEVMPMLDPVDEARSFVKIERNDLGAPVYRITSDMKLCFDEARVGSHHAFRLNNNFSTIVCDDAFKAAVKENKLTGLQFQDVTAS